jgi:hypothetical protein
METKLDYELERPYKKFPFLWEKYDFHLKYFTRDYGMYYRGFIIGLENGLCKLVFEKETDSVAEPITEYVGTKKSQFAPPNYSYYAKHGWYTLPGLLYWLSGVECERDHNVDRDLENISQYLELHIDQLMDLFRKPEEFDQRLEYYRNLHKQNQLTVEKIRAERARLRALGRDDSLEAAINSLRGRRK